MIKFLLIALIVLAIREDWQSRQRLRANRRIIQQSTL